MHTSVSSVHSISSDMVEISVEDEGASLCIREEKGEQVWMVGSLLEDFVLSCSGWRWCGRVK